MQIIQDQSNTSLSGIISKKINNSAYLDRMEEESNTLERTKIL